MSTGATWTLCRRCLSCLGTVADNIRYGRPKATEEEVAAAARQIGGGEWIELLPDGLDTGVGVRSNQLSMGQRQLVALARVLQHDPSIVILDGLKLAKLLPAAICTTVCPYTVAFPCASAPLDGPRCAC